MNIVSTQRHKPGNTSTSEYIMNMSRRHKVSENFQFVYISEITIILSSLKRLRICSHRTGFLLLCHIIMCLLVFVIYACDFNLNLSIGNLRFYICIIIAMGCIIVIEYMYVPTGVCTSVNESMQWIVLRHKTSVLYVLIT